MEHSEYDDTMLAVGIILLIGFVTLLLVILAGDYYLTRFSFNSENNNGARTITLTDTQLNLARTSVVVRWILLGLFIISCMIGPFVGPNQ